MSAATSITALRATTSARQVLTDYGRMTKPRIVELLLITTIPSMVLAAGGWPGTVLLLGTLGGGALVAGSAHATNMILERDIDAVMARTADRPLPAGRVTPTAAAVFAALLLLSGSLVLGVVGGVVTLLLALVAWGHYVVVYTMWLKRRTPQNIVIGGAAGAMPPLIGWAAVTGTLAPPAWVLFAVVVLWTPTHFWALGIARADDYALARVPMLPVLRGPAVAARHGFVYAAATVAASLLLPLVGVGGAVLAVVLAVLGVLLLVAAGRLTRDPSPRPAWRLFHASNAYLALVFTAVAVTGLVQGGGG